MCLELYTQLDQDCPEIVILPLPLLAEASALHRLHICQDDGVYLFLEENFILECHIKGEFFELDDEISLGDGAYLVKEAVRERKLEECSYLSRHQRPGYSTFETWDVAFLFNRDHLPVGITIGQSLNHSLE